MVRMRKTPRANQIANPQGLLPTQHERETCIAYANTAFEENTISESMWEGTSHGPGEPGEGFRRHGRRAH
jgi:hypothetical protein